MHRKILGICAALVALGALVVAPSMASAAVTLQDTAGEPPVTTKVEVGKKIIADSEETALFNAGGGLTVNCNENVLTGTVHKNDGEEVQGTIEAAWFQSNLNATGTKCRSPFLNQEVTVTIPELTNEVKNEAEGKGVKHWCIRTVPGTDNFQVWGNNCTTATNTGGFTFILDFPNMTCSYKTNGVAFNGTFTTATAAHEATTLELTDKPKFETDTSSSIFCPANGTLENFKFRVFTDTFPAFEKKHTTHPFGAQPTVDPVFLNPVA